MNDYPQKVQFTIIKYISKTATLNLYLTDKKNSQIILDYFKSKIKGSILKRYINSKKDDYHLANNFITGLKICYMCKTFCGYHKKCSRCKAYICNNCSVTCTDRNNWPCIGHIRVCCGKYEVDDEGYYYHLKCWNRKNEKNNDNTPYI